VLGFLDEAERGYERRLLEVAGLCVSIIADTEASVRLLEMLTPAHADAVRFFDPSKRLWPF
jgi:hypothetical protein